MFLLLILSAVSACGKSGGSESSSSLAPEAAYCSGPKSYASPVTLSGTAQFTKRLNEPGGLSANESDPLPIRFAEVEILDATGIVVQCSNTDAAGKYSVQVPASVRGYTVSINSRANNSHALVSVLDSPSSGLFYALSTRVPAGTDQVVPTMIAHATGDILGGAFNILDDVVKANEFLMTNTSNCSQFFAPCQTYVPAYKCSVFWKKGFNPGSYVGTSSGLSYYLPGLSQLYILGGMQGDVDNSDTDHFDDSVIVHEYGHFIEDHYAKTDSPGGFHSASRVIDPRLAWGEGWADFFSSAVLNTSVYKDTCGNKSGSPCGSDGYLFKVDVLGPDSDYPTARAGEGNFHELSISSTFYNYITGGHASYDGKAPLFNELWATFSGPFRDSSQHFRNFGLFMQIHNSYLSTPGDFSSVMGARFQKADQTDYAQPIYVGGPTCAFTTTYGNTNLYFDPRLDWLGNNDTYQVSVNASGAYNFSISRTAGAADAVVNVYLFNEQHIFIAEGSCGADGLCFVRSGELARNVANTAIGSGDVNLSANLAAGKYILVVNFAGAISGGSVNIQSAGTLTYGISANGVQLCGN